MKAFIVSGLAAAALFAGGLATPSLAQNQTDQQMAPGTGGTSKPGVQGMPGGKSGATVKPSSKPGVPEQKAAIPDSGMKSNQRTGAPTGNTTINQDESKVPGMSGNKSGPAAPKQKDESTTPGMSGGKSGVTTKP